MSEPMVDDGEWYRIWYNKQPNRKKCPYCHQPVDMRRNVDGELYIDLTHLPTCDTQIEI